MIFGFSLEDGATNTAAANTWNANGYTQSTKQTNFSTPTNIGKFFYVTGVQLEVGSVCTPFEMKPTHTELLMCQRYYQKYAAKTSSGAIFGCGVASSTASATIWLKYNTQLRAAPTFVYQTLNHTSINDGTLSRQIVSYSLLSTLTTATITATPTNSTLTANRAYVLVQTGTTLAWFDFLAEL